MPVTMNYSCFVSAIETIIAGINSASSDPNVTKDGLKTTAQLNASSTPPVTQAAEFTATLSGGALTLDLQVLTGIGGATLDLTGLKIIAAKFKCPSSNTGVMNINEAAANSYNLGGTTYDFDIPPGGEMTLYFPDNSVLADVGASASDIDLAGTGSETVDIIFVAG